MTERPESYESAKAICENYDGFPAIIDTIPEKVQFDKNSLNTYENSLKLKCLFIYNSNI